MSLIEINKLEKRYKNNRAALSVAGLAVQEGSFLSIIGPSGAGKSTLLHCLNGLVESTSSDVSIAGINLSTANRKKICAEVSMIFQHSPLVDSLSVFKNVLLGRLGKLSGWRKIVSSFTVDDRRAALSAIRSVGMLDLALRPAGALSGGQKQRVAIARALCQGAKIILADEPVASLDPENAVSVLSLLKRINEEEGVTVVVNLHQVDWAKEYSDEIIGLKNGKTVFVGKPGELNTDVYKEIYR